MGNNVVVRTTLDGNTGEVIKEKKFFSFDGFTEKGYKYRYRAGRIQIFPDTIPDSLSGDAFQLLYMLAELANDEGVLVYRVTRKSKFSEIIYKPLYREEIMRRLRWSYGHNKFDKCFRELKKHCIKKVPYYNTTAWCLNPAIVMIGRGVITPFMYDEFKLYLNPYMSRGAIKKMQDLLG